MDWRLHIPLLLSALAQPMVAAEPRWSRSFDAGYLDDRGAYAGGSEIMHIVAHGGRLFAANGYWVDAHWVIPPDPEKQSAQVLRLDAADAQWQVDLDLGRANDGLGLRYMKGNILKSVTFTRGADGTPLTQPTNLLVMAAGANLDRGGAVSAWTRDDATGAWTHTLVRHGSSLGGVRWVPRDMEVHLDQETGRELLLLSLGNPGIVSGRYDPEVPGRIRWARHLEHPFPAFGSFKTRPLGMARANGNLYISEGGTILQRIDGERPSYQAVLELQEDADTDIGGVRGLTAIPNPNGPGESLLFLWAPATRSRSQVKRLDPDGAGGYTVHDEASMADLMSRALDVPVSYTLGAHNMFYPVRHPGTGETVHLIGFQGNILGKHDLRWKPSALYGGAMYAVRRADGSCTTHEVNNAHTPGRTALVAPRAFCLSPFGDDHIYIGGHDASRRISDDMAWIFRAPTDVVLGIQSAASAPPSRPAAPLHPRLLAGPVHELRVYTANENRHGHLVKRFREHTDRIFKRHDMDPLGYWIPTDGTPKQKRKLVYILSHPSRYAAFRNWNRFTTDREWEQVVGRPEFKGLLAGKPLSVHMNTTDVAIAAADAVQQPGGVFQLRTHTTRPGQLDALLARFREHDVPLLKRHGVRIIGAWTPFDRPDSEHTLITLLHHANRAQADANWRALHADPAWRAAAEDSASAGKLLAAPPQDLYLRALDLSPIR